MTFRLSSQVIHLGHLVMGAFFAYVGYYKKMNKQVSMALLVLGALAAAYHGHLLAVEKGFMGGREGFSEDLNSSRSNMGKKEEEEDLRKAVRQEKMGAY